MSRICFAPGQKTSKVVAYRFANPRQAQLTLRHQLLLPVTHYLGGRRTKAASAITSKNLPDLSTWQL